MKSEAPPWMWGSMKEILVGTCLWQKVLLLLWIGPWPPPLWESSKVSPLFFLCSFPKSAYIFFGKLDLSMTQLICLHSWVETYTKMAISIDFEEKIETFWNVLQWYRSEEISPVVRLMHWPEFGKLGWQQTILQTKKVVPTGLKYPRID